MKTKEQLLEDLRKLGLRHDLELLDNEWLGGAATYNWKCKNGHILKHKRENIAYRRLIGCVRCRGFSKTIEDCQVLARKKGGECLSTEYINNITKMKWKCSNNHVWEAIFMSIKKAWCPYCAGNARHDLEFCQKLAKRCNGRCLSTEYKNHNTKMLWECEKKHRFYATVNHIGNYNSWCNKCTHQISKKEQEIFEIIKEKFKDAMQNKSGLLRNKHFRLDIWIPSLSKAIEYDGTYWHSFPKSIIRDSVKDQQCKEVNIQLLRIKEADYLKDSENIIKEIFNFLNNPL